MKKLLLLLIFNLVFAKILIVNSYDEKDQCGIPQLNGFLSLMYENHFTPKEFDIFFLNSRVKTKKELIIESKKILKHLNKYDYVVTFDDAAFRLIGIPASKRGKIVFFSGINIPFKTYRNKYHLCVKKFGGVYEKLYAKEVLQSFNKIKPIKKIALFYSDGVGKLVKGQILNELKNSTFEDKIELIYCKTVKCLIKKSKEVNNNPKYTLFMPMTLSLKEKNKKIPFYRLKDIYLNNIKKPDVSMNMFFVKMGFIGFGGVDFFVMGQNTAKIMLNYIKTKKLEVINAPKAYYFINAKRAKKINFEIPKWFLKNNIKEIVW